MNIHTKSLSTPVHPRHWLALLALLLSCPAILAQTLVSGSLSGTWTPAGNPYIATDNCTVPSGQTLTIQPGVIVWVGQDFTITVNGLIEAVGIPTNRITFQAPIASQHWNTLFLYPTDYSTTNRFKYCDFSNARTAVTIGDPIPGLLSYEIMNCSFSNCTSSAIYAQVGGDVSQNPVIKNCVFRDSSNGCVLELTGTIGCCYGKANASIVGNIFENISGAALLLTAPVGGNLISPAHFINNTIINSQFGVSAADPWDAQIQDNIFVGTTNAVQTSGALSRGAGYNCFSGNVTNFVGYPSAYGLPIIANRNGTSCDILYNIFQDPSFVAFDDYHLKSDSPCIDAGRPEWAFTDMCFPPSLGASFPDQGAYGGPDACNWLEDVPKLPVNASITKSDDLVRLDWGAIPRSEYQVQYVTEFLGTNKGAIFVMTNIWLDFTNGRVLATEKPTSIAVGPDPATTNVFFRVQSLGRMPGN